MQHILCSARSMLIPGGYGGYVSSLIFHDITLQLLDVISTLLRLAEPQFSRCSVLIMSAREAIHDGKHTHESHESLTKHDSVLNVNQSANLYIHNFDVAMMFLPIKLR